MCYQTICGITVMQLHGHTASGADSYVDVAAFLDVAKVVLLVQCVQYSREICLWTSPVAVLYHIHDGSDVYVRFSDLSGISGCVYITVKPPLTQTKKNTKF